MQHEDLATPKLLLLRKLTRMIAKMKKVSRKPIGDLSGSQLLLLPIMNSFEEPPTLGELAAANGTSYQNTRQLLNKLESAGYTAIAPDRYDNRAIRVVLTDKGNRAVARYDAMRDDALARLYQGLSDEEVKTALAVIDTLYDRLDTLHA